MTWPVICSISPWVLSQLGIVPEIISDPKALYDKGLSDHAPFQVRNSSRVPVPAKQQLEIVTNSCGAGAGSEIEAGRRPGGHLGSVVAQEHL